MRVFVDASVLFSAVISLTGASRELLRYAVTGDVKLVVSPYVLAEVEANLAQKAPLNAHRFEQIKTMVSFELVQPDPKAVQAAAEYTVQKDAPVVAAAMVGECAYLTTFDRKHLIDPPEVAARSGLKVVTPDAIVLVLRQQLDEDGEGQ
jgi:predicted nucleic acid-binding protein